MKNKRIIFQILCVAITLISCSPKNEDKSDEQKEVVKAKIDTSNILIAQVCLEGKYGFIGTDFKFIINPQFDGAMTGFSEGLACVQLNKKWGFINIKGEFVIQPRFDEPGVFHEGLAKVSNLTNAGSDRFIYINANGENIFNKEFHFATDFNNGTAQVKDGTGKTYFINKQGNEVPQLNEKIYNHFIYSKKPFGGEVSKSLKLDPKTGRPVDIKYDKTNYGYTDELGYPATEAIYCGAGEFKYSFQTPKNFFSNKEDDVINAAETTLSVVGEYISAESLEGDAGGVLIVFKKSDGQKIVFDGYNVNSKLIPLYFLCNTCTTFDITVKSKVGAKYLLKYSIQKAEGEGGEIREFKILEAIDNV